MAKASRCRALDPNDEPPHDSIYNYSNVAHDEFNDWYDTERLPALRRIKGFVNTERWIAADQRNETFRIAQRWRREDAPHLPFEGD